MSQLSLNENYSAIQDALVTAHSKWTSSILSLRAALTAKFELPREEDMLLPLDLVALFGPAAVDAESDHAELQIATDKYDDDRFKLRSFIAQYAQLEKMVKSESTQTDLVKSTQALESEYTRQFSEVHCAAAELIHVNSTLTGEYEREQRLGCHRPPRVLATTDRVVTRRSTRNSTANRREAHTKAEIPKVYRLDAENSGQPTSFWSFAKRWDDLREMNLYSVKKGCEVLTHLYSDLNFPRESTMSDMLKLPYLLEKQTAKCLKATRQGDDGDELYSVDRQEWQRLQTNIEAFSAWSHRLETMLSGDADRETLEMETQAIKQIQTHCRDLVGWHAALEEHMENWNVLSDDRA